MKTLVIGASLNPQRYSFTAVNSLVAHQHDVVAIGIREGLIGEIEIITGKPEIEDLHTVTLYINPKIQEEYIDYILSLNPQRIIFNPGTENLEFYKRAKDKGIQTLNACTLVMLNTDQYT